MANVKAGGFVVVFGLVASFLESIFIPMQVENYTALKASTVTVAQNNTIDRTINMLFYLPLFTVIGSLIAGIAVALLLK